LTFIAVQQSISFAIRGRKKGKENNIIVDFNIKLLTIKSSSLTFSIGEKKGFEVPQKSWVQR